MKKLLLIAVMSLFGVSAALADVACPTGPLTQYLVANFTCNIDNVLDFSNWGYSSATVAASTIAVTPLGGAAFLLDQGFQFAPSTMNVGTTAGPTSNSADALITFTVSTVNGAATLDDLSAFFNGSVTGTGLSSFTENFCEGHPLGSPLCNSGNSGQIKVTNPPPSFNDHVTFSPVASVSVSKDVNVTSGLNGTAMVSQYINNFSQIPEPAHISLLTSGLLVGLGLLRKYRQSRG
jgi:hypothetical protein